ncbi:MAG: hypothetical protein KOO63_01175 [Bacteroidales bacterium]|nr:hypothetical protein [Candidatus Latescibacterota bacterium]
MKLESSICIVISIIILNPGSGMAWSFSEDLSPYLSREVIALDTAEQVSSLRPDSTSAGRLKALIDRERGDPALDGASWRRKKNPRIAMLSALAIPGLGQIYNEKPLKAAIAAGFEIFYLSRILHYYRMEKREEVVRDSYPRWVTSDTDPPQTYQSQDWTYHDLWVEEYKQKQIDWIWWSAGCILVVVLDAYIDANLHDMNFKLEGSPLEDSVGLSVSVDF